MSSDDRDLLTLLGHPTVPVQELYDDEDEKGVARTFSSPVNGMGPRPAPVLPEGTSIPDTSKLGDEEHFSLFIPRHAELAADLIQIFMRLPTRMDLKVVAEYCRDRVNPSLFQYAFSVAMTHRKDTSHVRLPSLMAIFPERFIISKDWARLHKTFSNKRTVNQVVILDPDFTATDLEEEHRLAYFREDPGLNIHHYHWHLVYPTVHRDELKRKDRQGELFYYMHQQIIARYNFERYSNQMRKVERLLNWYDPVPEAYFPKLPNTKQGGTWMCRQSSTSLKNITRTGSNVDILALERYRDRIYNSIHRGSLVGEHNNSIPLNIEDGIDLLGSLVEANDYSKNKRLYGSLHNSGHDILAFSHDPDGRHTSFLNEKKEVVREMGVMGDVSTACRDPVFYRWHAFIDDLFQDYKRVLPPYTDDELYFSDVNIQSVDVESEGTEDKNEFITFWDKSIIDIQQGIDFAPVGQKRVQFKHLHHKKFTYKIKVASKSPVAGTVRIFLSPKYDESNRSMIWDFQRTLFIELDKFQYQFVKGDNTIERKSSESTVTIPFEQQFLSKPTEDQNDAISYCSCGWPHHLLIPKGRRGGMACHLFVMVTNYEDDKVEIKNKDSCKTGSTYCGIRDEKYPDKRAMGFPFDRLVDEYVKNVDDFVKNRCNMNLRDVSIRFAAGEDVKHLCFDGEAPYIIDFHKEISQNIGFRVSGTVPETSKGFTVRLQYGGNRHPQHAVLHLYLRFEGDCPSVKNVVLSTVADGAVRHLERRDDPLLPLFRNKKFCIIIRRRDGTIFQVTINGTRLHEYETSIKPMEPTHLVVKGGVKLSTVTEIVRHRARSGPKPV